MNLAVLRISGPGNRLSYREVRTGEVRLTNDQEHSDVQWCNGTMKEFAISQKLELPVGHLQNAIGL